MSKKKNPNSNSVNFNNFNHLSRGTELNKTPVTWKSQNSTTNLNNNNIIINNKFEAQQEKPITNLNMILKFKTIVNGEASAKNNTIIKIDAKKIIRNSSSGKAIKIGSNYNKEKSASINFNSTNNGSNSKNNNTININNTNTNYNNLIQNKKASLYLNSTLKQGNSTSKSKAKNVCNTNNLDCKNFDTLKYSINQLKDYLNPNFHKNSSKSNSKSKGKMGSNFGKQ